MQFDIVIPLGQNEKKNIRKQLEYTKKNVIGYRNIYIITNNSHNLEVEDCKIIDENNFPFKMNDVASFFNLYKGKKNRNGWYLQQLLKIYASFVIEDLLDDYLVVDADVYFLKPIEFLIDNKYLFATSGENHDSYFKHMLRLHPTFKKQIQKSGIAHHMLFNRQIVKEMIEMVENHHKRRFWVMFIELVDEHKKYDINVSESGASEYELYFNYMLTYHKDKIVVRDLNWCNKSRLYNLNEKNNYHYISLCSWMKK